MKIDAAVVKKIATLARLEVPEEELDTFAGKFAGIVAFVEQLAEVDTTGVDADDIHGRADNVLAEDRLQPGLERDAALANAPAADGVYFLAPKVIGEEGA